MICISELRGLQEFQSRHPEIVVVAVSITNERDAIEKLLRRQKLSALRTAVGEDWQGKFGLSEAIPATVLVEAGRIRIVHSSVMPDPLAQLEADLAAMHGSTKSASESGKPASP
jgi:hypothetical protein